MIHRLNLSFALLLLCTLAITAAVIYPLMLDTLVEGQRKELREQGSELLNQTLAKPTVPAQRLEEPAMQDMVPLAPATKALLIAPDNRVLFSTLPALQAAEMIEIAKRVNPATGISHGKDGQYIVETLTAAEGEAQASGLTAVMAAPLSKVKSIQLALFQRMMIILTAGGIMAFLLSMFVTRRLVDPLAKLRKELKKVERRRFSEVRLVKSGGEIGEVARSVYQLAGELEKYQHTQKQFFQNASHELKTPLMSIQGYAEGINDGIFTGESAERGLNIIVKECERLKKIVTEMILLAKLESEDGIFHPDRVSVADLIQETVERINPLLVKKGHELNVNISENANEQLIYVDRGKVLQALINVAGNAARYARHTITIDAAANGNYIAIEIADDGDGISEQLLPQLFERFSKGKNGETGLGLAISRAIVERCGGRITARNQPGGGALFSLQFPVLNEQGPLPH
ncbi:sensor histidine kinase [Paenibacillus spongiae]|uniref:histidine kinase n=1 Tax=Paenibacillus spongiae TaxID=2909671 RepID=A0ABY5S259_9BACL|nr:HAMP domain-containing sensor histidine kinase [Paenibacillus spongiae]UVI27947.1 HAMP domain-containing histidine kinase [Paenibacillus spongiae]